MDAPVAAAFQRQKILKKAFKTVREYHKTALLELGGRTEHAVDNDPSAHTKSDQFKVVQAQLDARYAKNLSKQENLFDLKVKQAEKDREMETDLAEAKFRVSACLLSHSASLELIVQ